MICPPIWGGFAFFAPPYEASENFTRGAMGGQNRPIVSFFEVLAPPHEGATSAGGVLGGQSTFWPDHGGVTSKIVGGQPKIRVAPPNVGGAKFC